MQSNSMMKAMLAGVLCVSLIATGCTAQWISVALADLPVLTQMALNITSLVVSLRSARQISPADAAAIQNISTEASKDLNLLQSLYNQYKASPDAGTLLKIHSTMAEINQNLPALLAAVHISDPVEATRITAGVNLILTTVQSFAALMPGAPAKAAAPVAATNGGAFVTLADEDIAKCNNCKTCYQDLPELFEKTKIVVNGETKEVGHLIPGVLDRIKATPELKAKVARVAANCDAEIVHEH